MIPAITECTQDAGDHNSAMASVPLRLAVHQRMPQGEEFHRCWDELVTAMESVEVFYTWEWAEAILRANSSLAPIIIVGRRGDRLAGVAALKHEADGYVSFLTAVTADYCDFVSHPADRCEFVEAVFAELRRMNVMGVRLANLPTDSVSIAALRAAAEETGYSLLAKPAYFCAQVMLDSECARLDAAISARRRIKKLAGAASRSGELSVTHVHGWEDFSTEFPQFVTAHIARFSGSNQLSHLHQPERQNFLVELAKLLSVKRWVAFSTLKLNTNTIAWNYGFRFAGKWFYYQPAFVNGFERLSPGTYLLSSIIGAASEDPVINTVELGLGDEDYKRRYTQSGRSTLHVTAHCSRIQLGKIAFRYHAAQFVKKSSRLEKIVRACRRKVATTTQNSTIPA